MKAAQIDTYGDAGAVQVREVAQPVAGDGQVLVKVAAASINPIDVTLRSGVAHQYMPISLPATLGGDFAGTVTAVGSGVTHVVVGDKVYGQAVTLGGGSGTFAEYTVARSEQVAKAPETIDLTEAASLPLVGVSALQGLTDHLGVTKGQKLLITGGAGGIGTAAIQLAKHLGAQVVATATGNGVALATKLGADEVIDYKARELADLPKDFDAVFDNVGGPTFEASLQVLKPGGKAVSMAGQVNEELAKQLKVTAVSQMTKVTTEALDELRKLVEAGVITPHVGKVFDLDHITEAFQAKESGHIPGKIVVTIN